jgi:protein arginine N-methyltransferase 1
MLLNDPVRMNAYRSAIQRTVHAGNVVLDVGSGSGILALFACQAGAARVYCVELGPIIEVARQLAAVNGFGDRIRFLREDALRVELPEKVDVIQSELIGKSALGEAMSEILDHCRDRFLKTDGRMLPGEVTLRIAPVESSAAWAKSRLPDPSAYDLNFAPMQHLSDNLTTSQFIPSDSLLASGQIAYSYRAIGADNRDVFDALLEFRPSRSGVLHGFVAWFSAELAEGVTLTNAPPGISSWDHNFFPLPTPVPVESKSSIQLRLSARSDTKFAEAWNWRTVVEQDQAKIAQFEQSSFRGSLNLQEQVRKTLRAKRS